MNLKEIKKLINEYSEKGFILQSIVFPKEKFKLTNIKKLLKQYNFKNVVDEKRNTYRFRQIDPKENANYITKKLSTGINLIFMRLNKLKDEDLLYYIDESDRKNKKYKVDLFDLNGNLLETIHFGAAGMSDYTQHKDEERRIRYIKRASKITDSEGNLTRDDPFSANFYSMRFLWNYDPIRDAHLIN